MQESLEKEHILLEVGGELSKQALHSRYEMEELLPIVAELSKKYTSNESTSISYEKANELMEAVLYCIRELEEEKDYIEGEEFHLSARQAYEEGYRRLVEKVLVVKERYHSILPMFDSYGNKAYYDTVIKGIPQFFLYYDSRYRPFDHLLTLDYPLLCTKVYEQCGIDAIQTYIDGVHAEQIFLSGLPKEYVTEVLKAYHIEYDELLLNISSVVMRNMIGSMMADKPITRFGFQEQEYKRMEEEVNGISEEKLKQVILYYMHALVQKGWENQAEEVNSYFQNDIAGFVVELKNAAKHHVLKQIFVL